MRQHYWPRTFWGILRLSDVTDSGSAFQAWERLGVNLKRRQSGTTTTHLDQAAASNINTLYYVATVATQTSQAEAASAVLTDALATDDGLSRTPELTTTTPVSSVSTPSATQQDSAAGITRSDSTSVASENSPASFPLFESQADIERVTSELGQMLDDSTIAASDAGFTASSLELATFRLVVINDLRTRGIHLANVRNVTLNQTEPALVALYRETGDSLYWQRFGRRNSVPNPLLMPGAFLWRSLMADVELRTAGKIFAGWTTININRSIESLSGYFELGVNVQPETDLSSLSPGQPFTLTINGQTVITGYLDGRRRNMTADSMSITISGRDKTADLIDCAAIYQGRQWKGARLSRLRVTCAARIR